MIQVLMASFMGLVGADSTPPAITYIHFKNPVTAGEKATLRLEVTDNLSSVGKLLPCGYFDKVTVRNDHGIETAYYESFGVEGLRACGELTHEAGNWYTLQFTVPKYFAPGIYSLGAFSIQDVAGNTLSLTTTDLGQTNQGEQVLRTYLVDGPLKRPTSLRVPRLEIVNTGVVDSNNPKVHSAQFNNPVQAGEKALLRLELSDDVSGIEPSLRWAPAFVKVDKNNVVQNNSFTIQPSQFTKVNDRSYVVELPTPTSMPSGTYALVNLTVYDNTGKPASLAGMDKYLGMKLQEKYQGYHEWDGEQAEWIEGLPVAKLEVTSSNSNSFLPPKIIDVHFTTDSVVAGSHATLRLQIKHNGSGMMSATQWFNFCGSLARLDDENRLEEFRQPGIEMCGPLVHEEGAWYKMEIAMNQYLPSGDYALSYLPLRDNTNFWTDLVLKYDDKTKKVRPMLFERSMLEDDHATTIELPRIKVRNK